MKLLLQGDGIIHQINEANIDQLEEMFATLTAVDGDPYQVEWIIPNWIKLLKESML